MAKLTSQSLKDKAVRDLRAGKLPQALKKAQQGRKSFPDQVDFHAIAGFVLTKLEQYKQAIPCFVEASRLKPHDPQFAENLANSLMQTGQFGRALSYAEKKLEQFPDRKELQRVIDEVTSKGENWREIIAYATKRLEQDPCNARHLMIRSRAYQEIEFQRDCARDINRAYELDPHDKYIACAKAVLLSETGKTAECSALLQKLITENDSFSPALLLLSTIAEPDHIPGLLQKVEHAEALDETAANHLAFAKAHLIRKRDGTRAAMASYAEANASQHMSNPYDMVTENELLAKTCDMFPTGAALPTSNVIRPPTPIFVVGQPRSGTTLMEVMLSAVDEVEGMGELPTAYDAQRACVEDKKQFSDEQAKKFEVSYRKLMPPISNGTTAFVDKMPHNYQRIGMLLAAFPHAKVINMLRDPRDVGLSKWMIRFPARGMSYTSNLAAIAHAANLYRKYMAHWDNLFSDRILTVQYESLVAEPEEHTRAVADFCDLAWTDDMLCPEKTEKQVRTASLYQVRKKISTRSIGGWREVVEDLKPMLDGLDQDLWPEYDLTEGR